MSRPAPSSPRWVRLLVALVLAVTPASVVALSAPAASAAETLQLVDPVTDNYKTWADDRTGPAYTDNRTSLLFSGIRVGDQTYVVPQSVRTQFGTTVGTPKEWHDLGGIPLATSVGGEPVARLTFHDHGGLNAWSYFRLWSDGTFGPLMSINRPAFVADPHPAVAGTLTLTSTGGAVLATLPMRYRYDAGLAALPETSVEWHGPLGRWYAGTDLTAPTPLNWASGIAVSPTASGAHASQVSVPTGASTVYVAPVDIAGLAVPRVSETVNLAWTPSGPGRPTAAAGPQAWRPVTLDLPAGSYALQATGTCPMACRYDMQPQALTAAGSTVVASDAPVATYRPDAEIRPAGGEWVGADIVHPDPQGLSASVPVGSSRTFEVRVTNDGTATDTFGLADAPTGDDPAFDFTWRYDGVDVTAQVHDDGWFVLAGVPVGASRTLELTVAAKPDATVGASTPLALHAYHSPAADGIKDVVRLAVTTEAAQEPEEPDYVRPPGAPEVPIQPCSRYAAPDGDDANLGTEASPVLSLAALTAALEPGQTGCLEDDSEIVLTEGGSGMMSGGTLGAPKIIRPATVGSRATVRSVPKFGVAYSTSDLVVMDVNFRGSPSDGGGNLIQMNGDRVMFDGVDISWSRNICLGVGASGAEAEDFVLIDSRIHDCGTTHDNDPDDPGGAHGAYLQFVRDSGDADAWGGIIYNTLFDHNDGRGLQLYPDADKVLVDHAVLYGNGSNLNFGAYGTAVRTEGSRVRNSIIGESRLDFDPDLPDPNPTSTNEIVGYFPSSSHNGAGNVVEASCLYNTVRPDVEDRLFSVTNGGNSLTLASMTLNQPATFVDVAARDFRLAPGSSCAGMGLTAASRLPGGPDGPVDPVDQPLSPLTTPSIAGKLRVGRTLTARHGRWAPEPTGYRYRWYVGGSRVDGPAGSKRTLELRRKHRGKRVSVRIDVLAPAGYLDERVTARRAGRVR